MDLHRFEGNPNLFFEPKVHVIDFFEIFFFEKGKGSMELNGHTLEVKNYSVFFISPFQRKTCHIPIKGTKGFHLIFQDLFLNSFFEDKLFTYRLHYFYSSRYPQTLELSQEDYKLIQQVLNEVVEELDNFQNDSRHIIRSLLYFILIKLNRLYSKRCNLSSNTQINSIVYKFKETLEQHIREFHDVNGYCRFLNISRGKLNTITKEHFGTTAKETIQLRLLQEIKIELLYTDKTIAEIADTLNFSEANNLTRFFNRRQGVSPSQFKQLHQNDSYL